MGSSSQGPRLFLGLDLSTQSLSATLLDYDQKRVVLELSLPYDENLPHYRTVHGVLENEDPTVVHSPPQLWVEALDLLFSRLKEKGVPLHRILAVTGSGQQHASIYLNQSFESCHRELVSGRPLCAQLAGVFSRPTSPIWMDSSTTAECNEIREKLGGRLRSTEITGSDICERFTGPQIRRFAGTDPAGYDNTQTIHLASSFLATLLSQGEAPIDPGDGAGMNLMDIRTGQWCEAAVNATASGLKARLPKIAPSATILGSIHPYFVSTYGFSPGTITLAWSGDNPSSVVGLGLFEPNQVAVSLGTSDTLFGTMDQWKGNPQGAGHVFGSPTGGAMTLLCFRNGSLAREQIRREAGFSWKEFSNALRSTPPGNSGGLLLPYFEPEILPRLSQSCVVRRNLSESEKERNCRAVVEAQMMSMRIHSRWIGSAPTRIHVTGGASKNREILQVMADVHGCPVYPYRGSNSAALGAALRAAHGYLNQGSQEASWKDVMTGFAEPEEEMRVDPNPDAIKTYEDLLPRFEVLQKEAGSADR